MDELRKIFNSNRLPAFFVGAGMSKRYLKNMPSWDELLISVSDYIGISKTQYYGMKQLINEDNMQMPKLASLLENKIRDKVIDGTFNIDEALSDKLKTEIPNNVSFLKLLIAERLTKLEIKEDEKTQKEIKSLKKSIKKINNIFTTNFDMFFEKYVLDDDDMTVFDSQESLYFTNSFGISEMYKIHGSIRNPKSMVINEKDYINYLEDMNLFVSKLYNSLIERPIIFLGYGLNDSNILKILEGFIKHFNLDDLKKVANNLIFIEYLAGEENLLFGEATFQVGNKQITMKKIKTDNYSKIFDYISSVKEAISAREIKRYKDIVYDIIANHEKNGEKVFVVNALDINKIDSNKMVLGIHPKYDETLPTRGLVGLDTVTFIEHALYNNSTIKFEDIAGVWAEKRLSKTHYFPTYYIKNNVTNGFNFGAKYIANYDAMEKRYIELKKKAGNLSQEKITQYEQDYNDSVLKPTKDKKDVLFHNSLLLLIIKKVSKDDFRDFLKEMYKKNKEYINNSGFKQCICYLDR
ncbi:SIR2 family protein [Acholeplasma laidlawii]|nr:SIR2 family protein [Acholeplasma laidlawii]NWH10206.1 SIR2 family protein [Acholeplasma laidlawii]NWH11597.1 SIR2 family protein [Acholeplasma laidlawii]NWH12994.1 SIR2 family protein [Acholeplasma laidlawii]NWH14739.1 SIR2 family protein [Acholeplasma laidlawii]OAN19852.1 hypothetical protein A2I99_04435 [Acholeplasma laidlawii]